jgi:hypothetical protein
LSWNVFRSLQEAGLLAAVAKLMTGEDHPQEPDLYLWGIRVSDNSFEPWDLLIAARERFESKLPVKRPLTEPDIALHLPGKYLVLIEAKFTSPNPFYERGPRKDAQSLTLDELLAIYWDDSLRILDYAKARSKDRVPYQLWRNMVFAEWMTLRDGLSCRAYHVNLVRNGFEAESAAMFSSLTAAVFADRFRRYTWEELTRQLGNCCPAHLGTYLDKKTARLRQSLNLFAA